jgi:hypothetical protein
VERHSGARFANVALAFFTSTLSASGVSAQTCHLGIEPDSAGSGVSGFSRLEAASYENRRYSGRYEGAFVGASYRAPLGGATLAMPLYHLIRNGLESSGPGDLALEARLVPFRRRVSLGAVLGGSLPTGSAKDELGMGHPMLSVAALVATELDIVRLEAILGYGRALADSSAHAHHALGLSPLVAPMNPSELEGILTATARASRQISTRLGISMAAPVGNENGSSRGASVFGVEYHQGKLRLGLEAAFPILGDPFRAKGAVELGVRF